MYITTMDGIRLNLYSPLESPHKFIPAHNYKNAVRHRPTHVPIPPSFPLSPFPGLYEAYTDETLFFLPRTCPGF